MSATPTISPPPRAATDPVLIARDQVICASWVLVAAIRASRLLAPDEDALVVANEALAKLGFGFRLVSLH
jgi:hypothetical protein